MSNNILQLIFLAIFAEWHTTEARFILTKMESFWKMRCIWLSCH